MRYKKRLIPGDMGCEKEAYGVGIPCAHFLSCRRLFAFLSIFSGFFVSHFLFFIFSLLSLDGFCQPGAEIGITAGGGYYVGDYNPGKHFNNTQVYIGGFYRYNLNDRFALRLNAGFSKIDMPDAALPDDAGGKFPVGINRAVTDVCGLVEFNFRSFMVRKVKESSLWTPYIFTGAGFLSAGDEGGIVLPLGVGLKFNLFRQLSCGVEWSARKTFTDHLDGVSDPWNTGETNLIYNKDWFFVAGVTFSYRFPTEPECHQ